MAEEKTFSAKQVATRIGTDARTLRKFFRASEEYNAVGQGGRYDFTEKSIPLIKKAFDDWDANRTKRVRQPSASPTAPRARKRAAATPEATPKPRKVDPKQGLHGNALDDDTFQERLAGIGARVLKHDLVSNKQGRLVENPYPAKAKLRPTEGHHPKLIPGFGMLYFPDIKADEDGVEVEEFNDADIPGTGDEDEVQFWLESGELPDAPEDLEKVLKMMDDLEEEE